MIKLIYTYLVFVLKLIVIFQYENTKFISVILLFAKKRRDWRMI